MTLRTLGKQDQLQRAINCPAIFISMNFYTILSLKKIFLNVLYCVCACTCVHVWAFMCECMCALCLSICVYVCVHTCVIVCLCMCIMYMCGHAHTTALMKLIHSNLIWFWGLKSGHHASAESSLQLSYLASPNLYFVIEQILLAWFHIIRLVLTINNN